MSLKVAATCISLASILGIPTWTAAAGAGAADGGAPAANEPSKKDCVTANETGQDLRRSGKLLDARAALAVCMSPRCPRMIREDCAQRLIELEAAMPSIVFVAKDADGRDLTDVRLSMDGQPLVARLTGTSLAIDPGEHRFLFESKDHKPIESVVVVREADKDRRVIAVLPLLVAPAPIAIRAPAPPPPPPPPEGYKWNSPTTHNVALGVGLVGLPLLAIGSVFGLVAKSNYDNAFETECHRDIHMCSAEGAHDYQTADNQAELATIAFIAGGALFAVGTVVFFTTPSSDVTVDATPSAQGATLTVRKRF